MRITFTAVSGSGLKPAPYVITDACNTIDEANWVPQVNSVAPFVLGPNSPQTLLAEGQSRPRTNNVRTAKSTAAATTGPTWTAIKSSTGKYLNAVAIVAGNFDVCRAGDNSTAGCNTLNCTEATPSREIREQVPRRYVARIRIDPNNSNRVFVVVGVSQVTHLWEAITSGTSWSQVTGSGATALLVAPVRDLAIDTADSNWRYAGSEVFFCASLKTPTQGGT